MDYLKSVQSRLPTSESIPTLKSLQYSSLRDASVPPLAFFRKRIRMRNNSKISVPLYLVLLFPCIVVIALLFLFIARHPDTPGARGLIPSGAPPSIRKISEKYDKVFHSGCRDPVAEANRHERANAAFVVLARNKELEGVVESIKSVERHFNRWFHYPYVFLNDGDFNSTFKETVMNYTSSTVEFGTIGSEHWGYPDWTDKNVAKEGINKQGDAAIMYGGMESYHHMCRFYSGFFYKHELLQKYEWYWRVEPEIKYFCDITYDPFIHMANTNKTYGFTIAVKELKETVPNIFRYASAYKRTHNLTSQGLWEMFVEPKEGYNQDGSAKKGTIPPSELPKDDPKYANEKTKPLPEEILNTEPGKGTLPEIDPEAMEGEVYNMCHFWSNFEIARLDFFRSQEYEDFFNMMDRSGGFWMERWGDAPIHSLAAGALLSPSEIHYFRDFGYRHTTIQHCPANAPARQEAHRPYYGPRNDPLEKPTYGTPALDKEWQTWKEEDDYWAKFDQEKENGVGCRCRCDVDIVDVEGKEGSCIPEWVEIAGGFVTPAGHG
ncbi:O-glycoside alpha-1,2-mannosyltransferase 4 [Vermiconidia calcicola]|uniref:O-glycoside alpha-1,2-mannosyltransferase 4 n=1 Tax=Vermiconidia calcicola TaxID=1690605 RepID=A0ACC3MB64_9PEZI|nr:O-glycoside alpha-1,2-mannosyltransferase 4 [Vermiconidia calcicola]